MNPPAHACMQHGTDVVDMQVYITSMVNHAWCTHGWKYFETSAWHPMRHHNYPEHLKVQVAAAALSLGDKLAPVLWLIAKAICMDACKRACGGDHEIAVHVWSVLGPQLLPRGCLSPPKQWKSARRAGQNE